MKKLRLIASLTFLTIFAPILLAQEGRVPEQSAQASSAAATPDVPLKLQIVITEYNGTQKISSLPYTLYSVYSGRGSCGSLRTGTKVPTRGGTYTTPNGTSSDQITYQDVGTNIDCRFPSLTGSDGRYHFSLTVQRSSVVAGNGTDLKPGEAIPTGEPLVRSFQDSFDVILRDGQTLEGSSSVDPATGNVTKVAVTLSVEK